MLVHFYHCFTILRSCKCGIIYRRFVKLYGEEKQVWCNIFIILLVRDIGADMASQNPIYTHLIHSPTLQFSSAPLLIQYPIH